MAEWPSARSECQTTGKGVSVLIAVREFGNTEGSNKIGFSDRSLINSISARGMHICGYEEKEKKKGIRLVLRRGMPKVSHVIDLHSQKEHTEIYKIFKFGVNRANYDCDTPHFNTLKFTEKCLIIRTQGLDGHTFRLKFRVPWKWLAQRRMN